MKECQLCKNCFSDTVETCPNDGMPTVHTISGEPVLEGKYQIECRLGQGGMGIVYKARHAYLKTQLAIKVILPDLVGNDPQLVTRFRQEALAAAAIKHQNVVGVTDYGVIDGTLPFLVMEYVEGESLHDLLAREKSLAPERAYELMSAVCAGVGAAHHQGIVHRDLKPLNIMICTGRPNMAQAVKILDFGLAKIKSGELLGSFVQAQTTGLMGSPYYMAPEQWADEEPDPRADVYSLGVMLYQVLTGDVPFKGSSIPAIMKKHISDPAPTLADAGVAASPDLERAIAHSLQKDRANRTPTVEDFAQELAAAIFPGSSQMHVTHSTLSQLPVSSLKIISKPPQSAVFVDSVSVGKTRDNGELLLEGVQSGNHQLRVTHEGFNDWLGDVVCDGKPQQIVAELTQGAFDSRAAIPRPDETVGGGQRTMARPSGTIPDMREDMAKTVQQDYLPAQANIVVPSGPGAGARNRTLLLGIGSALALLVIGVLAVGGAYWLGLIGGAAPANRNTNARQTPTAAPTAAARLMPEMIDIPGGDFMMGTSSEEDPRYAASYPEHSVRVSDLQVSRTEVTNAQYLEFVKATGHVPPKHWTSGTPLPGTEQSPVTFVSLDDANAYARWLSSTEGGTYRLPKEQEWEYIARNGSRQTLFPWGNDWIDGNAVMGRGDAEPEEVGSRPQGANSWGILDLIGNVNEWTSSEFYRYPGNEKRVQGNEAALRNLRGQFGIRGGSVAEDPSKLRINSTFRFWAPRDTKDKTLGFRVVKEK